MIKPKVVNPENRKPLLADYFAKNKKGFHPLNEILFCC